MSVLLVSLGCLIMVVAFFTARHMSKCNSSLADRFGVALMMGAGLLLVMAATLRPDLHSAALLGLALTAAWSVTSPVWPRGRGARRRPETGQ